MDSANLPITGPCPIDLDAIGFNRGAPSAHCSHCDKGVHNLSAMTEASARAFLGSVAGRKVCVTYARGADGKIKFKRPGPALVSITRRPARRAVAAAAPALGLAAALAACTPVDNPDVATAVVRQVDPEPVEHLAGGIAPEPPPPLLRHPPVDPIEVLAGAAPVARGLVDVIDAVDMLDGEIEIPVEHLAGEAVPEGLVDPKANNDAPCDAGAKPKPKPKPARTLDALVGPA